MTDLNFKHGFDVTRENKWLTIDVREEDLDGSKISGDIQDLTEEEVEDYVGNGFVNGLNYDDVNGEFELDESYAATWTATHDFAAGLEVEGLWKLDSEAEDNVERLRVQAVGANDPAELFLQAKGSAGASRVTVTPDSSNTNYSYLTFESNGTQQKINSDAAGTESTLPLKLQVDGTDIIGLDSTPSATVYQDLNIQGAIDLEGTGADTVVTLDDTHDLVFEDDGGNDLFTVRENNGVQIHDREQAAVAVQYTTSASAPGTLELTNADLNMGSNAISNAASVSTDSLSNTDVTKGSTKAIHNATDSTADAGTEYRTKTTDSVSTSEKRILAFPPGNPPYGGMMVVVHGRKADTGDDFVDQVLFSRVAPPSVLGSISAGSPASRSYSLDSNHLALTMGSDSYEVTATGITAQRVGGL